MLFAPPRASLFFLAYFVIQSDWSYLKYEALENVEEHGLKFDIQLQNIYRGMEW